MAFNFNEMTTGVFVADQHAEEAMDKQDAVPAQGARPAFKIRSPAYGQADIEKMYANYEFSFHNPQDTDDEADAEDYEVSSPTVPSMFETTCDTIFTGVSEADQTEPTTVDGAATGDFSFEFQNDTAKDINARLSAQAGTSRSLSPSVDAAQADNALSGVGEQFVPAAHERVRESTWNPETRTYEAPEWAIRHYFGDKGFKFDDRAANRAVIGEKQTPSNTDGASSRAIGGGKSLPADPVHPDQRPDIGEKRQPTNARGTSARAVFGGKQPPSNIPRSVGYDQAAADTSSDHGGNLEDFREPIVKLNLAILKKLQQRAVETDQMTRTAWDNHIRAMQSTRRGHLNKHVLQLDEEVNFKEVIWREICNLNDQIVTKWVRDVPSKATVVRNHAVLKCVELEEARDELLVKINEPLEYDLVLPGYVARKNQRNANGRHVDTDTESESGDDTPYLPEPTAEENAAYLAAKSKPASVDPIPASVNPEDTAVSENPQPLTKQPEDWYQQDLDGVEGWMCWRSGEIFGLDSAHCLKRGTLTQENKIAALELWRAEITGLQNPAKWHIKDRVKECAEFNTRLSPYAQVMLLYLDNGLDRPMFSDADINKIAEKPQDFQLKILQSWCQRDSTNCRALIDAPLQPEPALVYDGPVEEQTVQVETTPNVDPLPQPETALAFDAPAEVVAPVEEQVALVESTPSFPTQEQYLNVDVGPTEHHAVQHDQYDQHMLIDPTLSQSDPATAPVRQPDDGWITTQEQWDAFMDEVENQTNNTQNAEPGNANNEASGTGGAGDDGDVVMMDDDPYADGQLIADIGKALDDHEREMQQNAARHVEVQQQQARDVELQRQQVQEAEMQRRQARDRELQQQQAQQQQHERQRMQQQHQMHQQRIQQQRIQQQQLNATAQGSQQLSQMPLPSVTQDQTAQVQDMQNAHQAQHTSLTSSQSQQVPGQSHQGHNLPVHMMPPAPMGTQEMPPQQFIHQSQQGHIQPVHMMPPAPMGIQETPPQQVPQQSQQAYNQSVQMMPPAPMGIQQTPPQQNDLLAAPVLIPDTQVTPPAPKSLDEITKMLAAQRNTEEAARAMLENREYMMRVRGDFDKLLVAQTEHEEQRRVELENLIQRQHEARARGNHEQAEHFRRIQEEREKGEAWIESMQPSTLDILRNPEIYSQYFAPPPEGYIDQQPPAAQQDQVAPVAPMVPFTPMMPVAPAMRAPAAAPQVKKAAGRKKSGDGRKRGPGRPPKPDADLKQPRRREARTLPTNDSRYTQGKSPAQKTGRKRNLEESNHSSSPLSVVTISDDGSPAPSTGVVQRYQPDPTASLGLNTFAEQYLSGRGQKRQKITHAKTVSAQDATKALLSARAPSAPAPAETPRTPAQRFPLPAPRRNMSWKQQLPKHMGNGGLAMSTDGWNPSQQRRVHRPGPLVLTPPYSPITPQVMMSPAKGMETPSELTPKGPVTRRPAFPQVPQDAQTQGDMSPVNPFLQPPPVVSSNGPVGAGNADSVGEKIERLTKEASEVQTAITHQYTEMARLRGQGMQGTRMYKHMGESVKALQGELQELHQAMAQL